MFGIPNAEKAAWEKSGQWDNRISWMRNDKKLAPSRIFSPGLKYGTEYWILSTRACSYTLKWHSTQHADTTSANPYRWWFDKASPCWKPYPSTLLVRQETAQGSPKKALQEAQAIQMKSLQQCFASKSCNLAARLLFYWPMVTNGFVFVFFGGKVFHTIKVCSKKKEIHQGLRNPPNFLSKSWSAISFRLEYPSLDKEHKLCKKWNLGLKNPAGQAKSDVPALTSTKKRHSIYSGLVLLTKQCRTITGAIPTKSPWPEASR